MVKATYPNKPGDFEIDGVSLIILPDKIIIDTGNRNVRRDDYRDYRRSGKKEGNGDTEKKKKSGSMWNDILDNAEDVVMGRKRMK